MYKIEIAVFVDRAEVPAVEPEILHDPKGLFAPSPITLEHDVRIAGTNDDLAGRSDRHVIVFVIDDPNFEAWSNLARSTGLGTIVVVKACTRTRFGPTVNIAPGDLDAEARPPILTAFGREGHAATDSELSNAT